MADLDELLVRVFKGVLHFSRRRRNLKDATVTRLITITSDFDCDLRKLAKYLHVRELDIIRLAVTAYLFEVECVKENPEGEWVFFPSDDAEESTIILANSMFLPVSK